MGSFNKIKIGTNTVQVEVKGIEIENGSQLILSQRGDNITLGTSEACLSIGQDAIKIGSQNVFLEFNPEIENSRIGPNIGTLAIGEAAGKIVIGENCVEVNIGYGGSIRIDGNNTVSIPDGFKLMVGTWDVGSALATLSARIG